MHEPHAWLCGCNVAATRKHLGGTRAPDASGQVPARKRARLGTIKRWLRLVPIVRLFEREKKNWTEGETGTENTLMNDPRYRALFS